MFSFFYMGYFKFYYFLNKIDFSNKFILNTIFIILLFIIFFESTEIKFLKSFISSFFIYTFKNKEFIYENVYVFGNLNGWRIKDTLGLIGFLPLFLIFVIFSNKCTEIDKNLSIRSYLLSVTPFLVFFTPLLSYI